MKSKLNKGQVSLWNVAYHEAGHAVVGIHLRLRIDNLKMKKSATYTGRIVVDDKIIGQVEVIHPTSVRAFRRVGGRYVPVNMQAELRKHFSKVITMVYAGSISESKFGPYETIDQGDAKDLEIIGHIQKEYGFTDKNLVKLKQDALRILGLPYVVDTIESVATTFATRTHVAVQDVRLAYRRNKRSHDLFGKFGV